MAVAAPLGLVINEVLLNPAGNDVNRDGSYAAAEDEFVELVNASGRALPLEGVQLLADTQGSMLVVHTFEPTCLAPAAGVVLFGGGTGLLDAPGALVLFPGRLNLNNTGDHLALHSVGGLVLDDQVKDAWVRVPDGTGAFAAHPELASPPPVCVVDGCPSYSAGRCSDGQPFATCLPLPAP